VDPFARCEGLFAAAPERWESARCFYETGRGTGLLKEAARRLEALSALHPGQPWPLLARAYVAEDQEAPRTAGWYRQAIGTSVTRGHAEGEVRARSAFADWLAGRGERQEAGQQLAAAVRCARRSGARSLLAEALIFQARFLEAAGTGLQEPYRLARQAESDLFPVGPAGPRMLCLDLLAGLERDRGQPERAGSYYRRLEVLARANGRHSLEAKAQLGLGLLLFDELDRAPRDSGVSRAAAQLRRALATAEEAGDVRFQAWSHSSLAHLAGPAEARAHLDRCLALARGRNDVITASCLLTLARLEAETDPAAAERSLAEASTVAQRSGDSTSLARFWYDRMNFHWRFGSREQALVDSAQAVQSVEDLRDRQLEQMGRAGLFSRWLAPYYAASGHLLAAFQRTGDPADLDRAFAITDSLRGRVLRELLGGPRSAGPPPSRSTISAGLAPEEALLSFQIAPRRDFFGFAGGSWLLVFTRAGTRVYPLSEEVNRARLETAVSAFLGLIERRDGGEAGLAETLRVQLLGPALADLPPGVNRLVILPDGALHRLPFAVLRFRGTSLGDRYRISTALSATLWERWRRQPRRESRAALVLADPRLPETLARTAELRGDGSGRLPGARREGEHVLRSCGAGVLRAGSGAGEAFLKRRNLSRFGVLHLAAHAVADEANPEASAVLLAADAPGEDGELRVDEISRLDLRGMLVALSSCRSAGGALVGGEGVMSLSRAFFAAGSAAVVGSLWPVRDDDAEAFFEIFYDHLSVGETAATAFSAAQRERLRDGAPAQAWAGFVLSGNGEWRLPPAPLRRPRSPLFFLVPVVLLTLTAALIFRFRIRA
jgi:tetratricopeptide (TPR) repeat protein